MKLRENIISEISRLVDNNRDQYYRRGTIVTNIIAVAGLPARRCTSQFEIRNVSRLCMEMLIFLFAARLAGWAFYVQGDHEGMLAKARQALETNPNSSNAHYLRGVAQLFSGHAKESLNEFREALRLDPLSPRRYNRLVNIAMAHYFLRDYTKIF